MSGFLLFFPFLLLSGGSSTMSSMVDCSGDDLNSAASSSFPVVEVISSGYGGHARLASLTTIVSSSPFVDDSPRHLDILDELVRSLKSVSVEHHRGRVEQIDYDPVSIIERIIYKEKG